MRVAHVVDSLRTGGAQRLLVNFASLAAARGWGTRVISLYADKDQAMSATLRSLGAEVASLPGRRLLSPGRFWRLVREIRTANVEVVHTHLTYANSIGVLAARLAGRPAAATLHSTGHEGHRLHPAAEALEVWALRWLASRVIAVGETVAEAYRPELGEKAIELIPNAVGEPAALAPKERLALRQEMAGDPHRPILISVGRFIPAKGYANLVEAFACVHAAYPQAVLALVGDGPLHNEVESQVHSLGIQDCVCLMGAKQDALRWLAAADLYVAASIWEGLPLAVLEAMMTGLPVVATAVGDLPRVLAPDVRADLEGTVGTEVGLVVPVQNPGALAQAIGELLADPDRRRRMSAAAQARARSQYSAEVWMDRLASLYEELRVGTARTKRPASFARIETKRR